jgi:hypothetical protein
MSPFPVQFTRRWSNTSRPSFEDAVCWHLLLGGHAAVRAAAATARQRLAGVSGLHMTRAEAAIAAAGAALDAAESRPSSAAALRQAAAA